MLGSIVFQITEPTFLALLAYNESLNQSPNKLSKELYEIVRERLRLRHRLKEMKDILKVLKKATND